MPQGTLEVLLVGAKGLQDADFLTRMDPYVIIICRTQEQRSSVASGGGSEPEWNETFVFTISEIALELRLRIMDRDALTDDDFVGEATVPLGPVFIEGNIPPAAYSVVKDQNYVGQVRVGLTFTPQIGGYHGRFNLEEESYGG